MTWGLRNLACQWGNNSWQCARGCVAMQVRWTNASHVVAKILNYSKKISKVSRLVTTKLLSAHAWHWVSRILWFDKGRHGENCASLLPGHLPVVATPVSLKHLCSRVIVGLQSSKKPIRDCFSCCRPFLKLFTVLAFTVLWSKLFHLLTSRSVKKMPSHFQFTHVFSQLQFMISEVLCGGQFKHRFHWYSRESFNHLK